MAEQGESATKLDTLLERVPIFDGGGRRRLSAGTLVALTVIAAVPGVRGWIVEAVSTKDISLSLFLAASTLLVYATGVIVELIGEIFLTRAVANAMWSYVAAVQYVRQKPWPLWAKVLVFLPVVFIWGTVGAVGYFAMGFFGVCRWSMRLPARLSEHARDEYCKLPAPVRESLENALGNKAEFGRKALIDQLTTSASQTWARKLMARPKDVLVLVSAVVLSIAIAISAVPPSSTAISSETSQHLGLSADDLVRSAREFLANVSKRAPTASGEEVKTLYDHILVDGDALVKVAEREASNISKGDLQPTLILAVVDDSRRALIIFGPESEVHHNISTVYDNAYTLEYWLGQAHSEMFRQQKLLQFSAMVAALFLYVAFFNTLSSATVSVIEALALERAEKSADPKTSKTVEPVKTDATVVPLTAPSSQK